MTECADRPAGVETANGLLRDAAAVVFDFDGVIVDSEPLHAEAIRAAAAPLGWTFTEEQFRESIVGRGDERCFASLASWHEAELTEEMLADLLASKAEHFRVGVEAGRFVVQPGSAELVRAAAVAKGGRVGLCSGSTGTTVWSILERLRDGDGPISACFAADAVVTADDVEQNKPHPEGYLLAASRLGVSPEEAVAIEDTPTGVAAARSAGLVVVAVEHTVGREWLGEAHAVAASTAELAF